MAPRTAGWAPVLLLLLTYAALALSGGPVPDASTICSDGAALAGIPFPFDPASSRAFTPYEFQTSKGPMVPATVMAAVYEARASALCARLVANATLAKLVRDATSDGVAVGPVAVDPSAWLAKRVAAGVEGPAQLLALPPIRALREAYFAGARDRKLEARMQPRVGDLAISEAFWALDTPARTPSAATLAAALGEGAEADPVARAMYEGLARDGFVQVERWSPLDIDRLENLAMGALDDAERARAAAGKRWEPFVTATHKEIGPLLRPLLGNSSLVRALGAYVDPDTAAEAGSAHALPACCSYGYQLLRLAPNATEHGSYLSSHWHHDRAGRRLKLFIFLHDVDPAHGRPTVVARGTHGYMYYSSHQLDDTRFAHGWVRSALDAVPMGGPRGGGFVFDTNTLHKGEHLGTRARSTVIVEIDRPTRCTALRSALGALHRREWMMYPCPSSKSLRSASSEAIKKCGKKQLRLR